LLCSRDTFSIVAASPLCKPEEVLHRRTLSTRVGTVGAGVVPVSVVGAVCLRLVARGIQHADYREAGVVIRALPQKQLRRFGSCQAPVCEASACRGGPPERELRKGNNFRELTKRVDKASVAAQQGACESGACASW
jgi:hypothetical protein